MYQLEDLECYYDAATLQYLKNKNMGGASGQKGTRYEDYFAVYKLAELTPAILEDGLVVKFSRQVLAFVDDLIIDILSAPLQHYQLKNSRTISWMTGDRSIQDDFTNQHRLNQRLLKRDSQLYLVVSDPAKSVILSGCIPSAIRAFSQVIHFPYGPIMDLIERIPKFRDALAYLSASGNPEPDKLEFAAKALLGAWIDNQASQVSGQELLTRAQHQTPQYIRSFRSDLALDPEVEKILNNIEYFKYNLAKGFLHWDYADGLEIGTPPYSIETEEFRRLQERIKSHCPTTFEELENFL
jgi:hypothetical protein